MLRYYYHRIRKAKEAIKNDELQLAFDILHDLELEMEKEYRNNHSSLKE